MTEIIKRNKALSVSPLKTSPAIGAALAFMGLRRAMPMLHGSQGCTAFGKVFFVRHFREPVALQSTAIDQVSAVMGGGDSVVEGLRTICAKSRPDVIGVPSTGLTETQGCDLAGDVRVFREKYPEYGDVAVIPVTTPDYTGCFETGYAKAVEAIVRHFVPKRTERVPPARVRRHQINVLAASHLTPGDLEILQQTIAAFGLEAVFVPDLATALDGHLGGNDFNPLSDGGLPVGILGDLGLARATLVIGASLKGAADALFERTHVPDYRFDHVMGLTAYDAFVDVLRGLGAKGVPEKVERRRTQLQDAMLDSHFVLGLTRVAVAADPDLLKGLCDFLGDMGMQVVAAVSPVNAPILKTVRADSVKIGDLGDLETIARAGGAEMVVCNAHGAHTARRLGAHLVRAGFPQYDVLGGFRQPWVGYGGGRDRLFEIANALLARHKGEVAPYRSLYKEASGPEESAA
ncbi:nitrogenase iron-molybdenum cofactor biosynthesis protein NifN [Varunaivibrio sulfuroxidans]|uniref:Nitrogenase iron-molybdenum cofactor biosynthesis protein NifN n=1 Tax=Varunaivibrio sulfuroxidans TaxID=1773489 RepID=A0A4R3JAR7_9PROT|nr:nitrogenase iron-molybdenum cofactor biosynthesis protein NifN [Varunaivibrio sulfuroxidans]TCS61750.1 nitrogenase molybdenum-iron protein NifN [Varunaivibrio sulfuroxidans]WES32066.1 nitrogenase iron-molybdenum cofactor biosynthesis protein NifN [Varunaivibrio sulfuroxidans]